jgi:hypothetical protein
MASRSVVMMVGGGAMVAGCGVARGQGEVGDERSGSSEIQMGRRCVDIPLVAAVSGVLRVVCVRSRDEMREREMKKSLRWCRDCPLCFSSSLKSKSAKPNAQGEG